MKSEDYRKSYNKMVTEINRQIKKLEKADPDSVTLERYRNYFQKVTTKNPHYDTMRTLYRDAKKLLESGSLSLERQERSKANAIATFHEMGLDFINRKNFNSFIRFMDDARERGLRRWYDSAQIMEAVKEAKSKGLTKEEILKNMDKWAEKMPKDEDGKDIEIIEPKTLRLDRRYWRKKK